jgi:beta-phosphoglucomutase
MSQWPRAVLFDFDGVIVNSEPLHFYAFHEVLKSERVEITEDEYYRDLIGVDDRGGFRHVYEKRNLPLPPGTLLALMARKSRVMMQLIHQRRFSALPGVEEFVRGLWRTTPLAICSGALREEIEAMLEGVSLRDCFSVIVAAEDVTVGKPDPQGYLLTLDLLSEKIRHSAVPGQRIPPPLKPADVLVIEDAPKVIQSVKAAGFPTLGVATSYPLMKLTEATWQTRTLQPEEVLEQVPQLKPRFVA